MSIVIREDKCIGCNRCLSVCPGSLIQRSDAGKAFIKYPKDCWGCTSCVKECRQGAILFYLGADMGGRGSVLYTTEDGDVVHWHIRENDCTLHTIDVNRKDSNRY